VPFANHDEKQMQAVTKIPAGWCFKRRHFWTVAGDLHRRLRVVRLCPLVLRRPLLPVKKRKLTQHPPTWTSRPLRPLSIVSTRKSWPETPTGLTSSSVLARSVTSFPAVLLTRLMSGSS
jgi:hypothetical protein